MDLTQELVPTKPIIVPHTQPDRLRKHVRIWHLVLRDTERKVFRERKHIVCLRQNNYGNSNQKITILMVILWLFYGYLNGNVVQMKYEFYL